jgi:ADP-heptose:LPS heptosyltransferase
MYTRVVRRPRGYRPRHAVENQWDLIAAIDPALAEPATPDANRVEMPVTSEAVDAADRALAALGVPRDAPLVLIHVSAGNPFRRWPEASFAAVAARLTRADDRRWTLVTAGPSDRDAAHRIVTDARRAAGSAGNRITVADALSLPALRATLDRAVLFLGGDSGPLHIAATTDVPIVGLYGPTLPERSAPWRPRSLPTASVEPGPLPCRPCDQRTCVPGDFRCLVQVSPDAVYAQAARLLELTR